LALLSLQGRLWLLETKRRLSRGERVAITADGARRGAAAGLHGVMQRLGDWSSQPFRSGDELLRLIRDGWRQDAGTK
jgi:hypothetical protein